MKMNSTSVKHRTWTRCAVVLSILSIALAARADVIYSGSETGSFGTLLNQKDSNYPNNGCVPTAVAQGLSYLANQDPSAFPTSPNNMTAVNALGVKMGTTDASGTTYPGRVTGTQNYLSSVPDAAYVVAGQYSPYYSSDPTIGPTAQNSMAANGVASFLANYLKANDGVEFALLWGSLAGGSYTKGDGGHFVTLQSISYNATVGTGTITFIDPGDARSWNGTLTLITGGTYKGDLYVSYSALNAATDNNPGDPADYGNGLEEPTPSGGDWLDGGKVGDGGVLINDLVEAVPEPSTYLAGAMLLIPFAANSVRRLRASRGAAC